MNDRHMITCDILICGKDRKDAETKLKIFLGEISPIFEST